MDRQTDRRTDERATYNTNTALALRASRGKNLQVRWPSSHLHFSAAGVWDSRFHPLLSVRLSERCGWPFSCRIWRPEQQLLFGLTHFNVVSIIKTLLSGRSTRPLATALWFFTPKGMLIIITIVVMWGDPQGSILVHPFCSCSAVLMLRILVSK